MYFYTMRDLDNLYEFLEKRRRELGLSQVDVGRLATGGESNSVFQNIRRGKSPRAETLAQLAEVLGLEFYFGPKRQPLADFPSADTGQPGFAEDLAMIDGMPGFSEGFATVPFHKETGDALNVAPFALARSWLRAQQLEETDMCVVRLLEDNPQLGLCRGDLALIDARKPVQATGEPMAFFPSLNSGIRVALLFEVPGRGYVMQDPMTGSLYRPENWGMLILVGRLVAHWRLHAVLSNHEKIELLKEGN